MRSLLMRCYFSLETLESSLTRLFIQLMGGEKKREKKINEIRVGINLRKIKMQRGVEYIIMCTLSWMFRTHFAHFYNIQIVRKCT